MKLNHLIIIGALCGALLLPSSASSWGVVGLSAGAGGGGCSGTYGTKDTSGTGYVGTQPNYLYLTKVTIDCTDTPDHSYFRLRYNETADHEIVVVVYDDDDGSGGPKTLLWNGDATYLEGNTAAGTVEKTISYEFASGSYYVGFIAESSNTRWYGASATTPSAYYGKAVIVHTFPTPPSDASGLSWSQDPSVEVGFWMVFE